MHCQLEVPFRVLPVGGSILCIASWRENVYGAEDASQSDQNKLQKARDKGDGYFSSVDWVKS